MMFDRGLLSVGELAHLTIRVLSSRESAVVLKLL